MVPLNTNERIIVIQKKQQFLLVLKKLIITMILLVIIFIAAQKAPNYTLEGFWGSDDKNKLYVIS
ncbi:hypothetical protein CON22_25860 [Bacillus cereus]|nr:hypothetical protein CON22_25860 [Bacillus cereus]